MEDNYFKHNNHPESIPIPIYFNKCCKFVLFLNIKIINITLHLYFRYTQPPGDLWDWYESFLDDEEVIL